MKKSICEHENFRVIRFSDAIKGETMKRLIFCFAISGCTDATMAHLSAIGDTAHVRCYSGGSLFYDGHSTGVVKATSQSDGWEFKDAETGKFVRISGPCVIEN